MKTTPAADQKILDKSISKRRLLGGFITGLASSFLSSNLAANTIQYRRERTKNITHFNHEHYMKLAIEEAKKMPEYPFGSVIVDRITGEIVAKGYNQSAHNPIFHGEIVAINHCAKHKKHKLWSELDLYTTAEPCSMCQSAIEWAGINNVYYGTSIPFLQSLNWQQINIRAQEVSDKTPFRSTRIFGGVLESECNELFLNALTK